MSRIVKRITHVSSQSTAMVEGLVGKLIPTHAVDILFRRRPEYILGGNPTMLQVLLRKSGNCVYNVVGKTLKPLYKDKPNSSFEIDRPRT